MGGGQPARRRNFFATVPTQSRARLVLFALVRQIYLIGQLNVLMKHNRMRAPVANQLMGGAHAPARAPSSPAPKWGLPIVDCVREMVRRLVVVVLLFLLFGPSICPLCAQITCSPGCSHARAPEVGQRPPAPPRHPPGCTSPAGRANCALRAVCPSG